MTYAPIPIFLNSETEQEHLTFKFTNRSFAEARLIAAIKSVIDNDCQSIDLDSNKYFDSRRKRHGFGFSTSCITTPSGEFYLDIENDDNNALYSAICSKLKG